MSTASNPLQALGRAIILVVQLAVTIVVLAVSAVGLGHATGNFGTGCVLTFAAMAVITVIRSIRGRASGRSPAAAR